MGGVGIQLVAFFTLVTVQSAAILLFKLAQTKGAYKFSPASSVALTELLKLSLAAASRTWEARAAGTDWFQNLSVPIVLHYFGLASMYTTNNILTFFVLERADPGTLSLFKSIAPYLCAIMLRLTGQRLNKLQWCCIMIQCCSIAIIQYDVTSGLPMHEAIAYVLLSLATFITASSSVWNQLVIKGFEVPLNLQNTLLYTFGLLTSIGCYFVGPAKSDKGFFEGYGPLAWALVLFQALHGLAVSFVYKHADAIVKNFANSSVMAVLVCISAVWFDLEMNLHSVLAVFIVVVTTYIYMGIAVTLPTSDSSSSELRANVSTLPADSKAATEQTRLLVREVEGGESDDDIGGVIP